MNKCQENKKSRLGMNPGTARHQLVQSLLFDMAKQLGRAICHRCQKAIESVEEFSIDHKKNWLYADDPKGVFFDLDNIAFSHARCNVMARGQVVRLGRSGYKGVSWTQDKQKRNKSWRAALFIGKQRIDGGIFSTAREAAIRYDELALEYLGEDALTNERLGLL